MNENEAFSILSAMKDNFINNIAHPSGGLIERKDLQNVDAFIISDECIVFINKQNKFYVVPSFAGSYFYVDFDQKKSAKKNRNFPTLQQIEASFLKDILPRLVTREKNISDEDKQYIADLVSSFLSSLPSSPENIQKLEMFNQLKEELVRKKIINS